MFNYKKNKNKTQQSISRESVDSSGASSNENLSSSKDVKDANGKILHRKIHFKVSYIGQVQEINTLNSKKRDAEAQLVDRIEEAQIEGKLPISTKDSDEVNIHISRHGIKVLDVNGQDVLQRHPLHTICQLVNYEDGFGRQNLALKIGQVGKTVYQCYVFQCHSEEQAKSICMCVKQIFDAIAKI
ncbi:integrin beta-1-binding protein 1 [Patella vulgata]|uniref:integrin beta-1-binding protein 1 n=1 Tax=Patella vulgata TaxID=6465 RepID=UPI0021807380|nr:integrin beta-1-binding protein 1 [Patella vulgata]XP_050417077.1 integrin beta-1-binding protein 1 [Patella vulgata]XP_050417078.1 integrin beta-1-binding protein 1 [Patella vulgata]XP_050417080.1 integrin beta-1-binding protein 1 [Patella vulgata]